MIFLWDCKLWSPCCNFSHPHPPTCTQIDEIWNFKLRFVNAFLITGIWWKSWYAPYSLYHISFCGIVVTSVLNFVACHNYHCGWTCSWIEGNIEFQSTWSKVWQGEWWNNVISVSGYCALIFLFFLFMELCILFLLFVLTNILKQL